MVNRRLGFTFFVPPHAFCSNLVVLLKGRLGVARLASKGCQVAVEERLLVAVGRSGSAYLFDEFGVARAIEDAGSDAADRDVLGKSKRIDVVGGRGIEIDESFRIAGSYRDLVHIN